MSYPSSHWVWVGATARQRPAEEGGGAVVRVCVCLCSSTNHPGSFGFLACKVFAFTAKMEAILTDRARNSLQQLMHRNAIFMCERLCAEFPSEKNLQLLASCYLQNNQAHCAYHILKVITDTSLIFLNAAICLHWLAACFQMDLLNEAEAALSPNESSAEWFPYLSRVPNGAAGHFLLGLVYRHTDRKQSAINHFNQALFRWIHCCGLLMRSSVY
ncbi:hypothetical protein SASPL_120481 [Salvia splendens]|uniref:Anaphase-promoting complex subunit 3 n=1 Tax=Salvia splendens TaxID=180675 RepID=A0A8X8XUD1_SALSN|nr:hypothetical protein SASPL_120481 [Salvia splendens]